MSDWPQRTIGDLCDAGLAQLQTGPFGSQLHAHDYVEHGIAVIPTEAIRNRRIDHNVLPQISPAKAEELSRHRLKAGDILFARRGVQATGHTAFVRAHEEGAICGTGAILLRIKRANDQVLPEFMSHVLSHSASVSWFKFHAIGATMPNLNEGIVRSFPFVLPPLHEQREIAALLSALDSKSDRNQQICSTLEHMARTLFRDWFVTFGPTRAKLEGYAPYLSGELWELFPTSFDDDDKPSTWRTDTLSSVAASPRVTVRPSEVTNDTPYIGLEHMPRHSVALTDWEGSEKVTSNKAEFRKGEFLFGKLRPYFHKVGIAPINGICSTDIVVIRPKSDDWASFVLACISSDTFVAYTDRTSTGTKMPRTKWQTMGQYVLCLPQPPVARAFQDIVGPMLDRIIANIHESRTLAATREFLLPKLISGHIRLREAEKAVEAVA